MFILYALLIGLVIGFLVGGSPAGLATLRVRWGSLIVACLLVQVVLFSDQVTTWIGEVGAVIYVVSSATAAIAVLANHRITGMPVIVLGAASNLAAIVANGGYMPASREALEALGRAEPTVYSNSTVLASPALAPLTDIFALPTWLPFANIFSVGDLLIGAGVVIVIVVAMRQPRKPSVADRPAARPLREGPETGAPVH